MRTLPWQNWRNRLTTLLSPLRAKVSPCSTRRTRTSYPLRLEPLEDRLAPAADLAITKVGQPEPVLRGNAIEYTIVVENIGDSPALGVALTDVVPLDTTFVSFTAPPGWISDTPQPGDSGTVTSTTSQMIAGEIAQFTLVVQVDPGSTTNFIFNLADVFSSDDVNPDNNQAIDETLVVDPTDLSITKTDTPDPVERGQQITYTITVTNEGSHDAVSASLEDAIPDGTTFVSFTAPTAWSITTPPPGGTGLVRATLVSGLPLGVGESAEFTLVVLVDPTTPLFAISNTATIASIQDDNPGNNEAVEETVIFGPDLSITKSDSPDPVARGDTLTYTITISNPGPVDAQNVTLTDVIPAGTTFVSFSAPAGFSSTTPGVGGTGTVISTAASMAPGNAVFTLVVRVNVDAVGTIANTATIASLHDPNALNDSAAAQTVVLGPDVTLTKEDAPDPVARGGNLTYTITFVNPGPGNALNVTLTDAIPTGTTFVSLTSPPGFLDNTPPVGGTGNVISTAASVVPGTYVFTLVVRVDDTSLALFVNNTVTVTTLDEVENTNNLAVATTSVTTPTFSISGFEDTQTTFTLTRFTFPVLSPGLTPSFSATINWGDGTITEGVVVNEGGETFAVQGTHMYTNESPHYPHASFPLSVIVTTGPSRFDFQGTAVIVERPFPGGDRGTPEDRWLAEIQDNLRDPSVRSINQDDAARLAFVNQWKDLLARQLARTGNLQLARRLVARQILTRSIVTQIATEILGRIPRRLSVEDSARLIDAFYSRYLEHGGRSSSWDLALIRTLRRQRRGNVLGAIQEVLANFMGSDEFYNKTFR